MVPNPALQRAYMAIEATELVGLKVRRHSVTDSDLVLWVVADSAMLIRLFFMYSSVAVTV